jgi:hypothetical protein
VKRLNEKGVGHLVVVLLLVVVLGGIGAAGYVVYKKGKDKSAGSTNTSNSASTDQSSTSSGTKSYTAKMFDTTVSLDAPAGWEVQSGVDTEAQETFSDASTIEYLIVTSPSGLSLSAKVNPGVGGICEPQNDTYTLVGSIKSGQDDLVFAELTVSDRENIEFSAIRNLKLSKPGESAKDTCNLGYYGFYNDARIKIQKNGQKTTYKEVLSDSDFVKVLESVRIQ